MSDFLDRVAARSVGGSPTLSPRLPSWFEPPRDTPAALTVDDAEAKPRPMAAPPHATEAPPATATPRGLPAPASASPLRTAMPSLRPREMPSEKRAAAAERGAPPAPVPDPTKRLVETVLRRIEHVGDRAQEARHVPVKAVSERPAMPTPPSSASPAEAPLLVPPREPVFASPAKGDERTAPPGRSQQLQDGANGSHARAEPVVQVSIGRLEVRAAPVAAPSASRRREGARPASLDDYLRQLPGGRTP
ncbi:hypothetical protein RKE25_20055 [Dyella sp. BiH032]|uniref:hypothetical protein n=1 Tax=Dyella sp. BiH032 TaxID=3075430 RepID=UPI00289376B2|nr:hypothetical protein [Dyella sp. BiH032]WNL45678.1 hypothetical protein RKE25_20055 [Dyella sp. BiH032]